MVRDIVDLTEYTRDTEAGRVRVHRYRYDGRTEREVTIEFLADGTARIERVVMPECVLDALLAAGAAAFSGPEPPFLPLSRPAPAAPAGAALPD